MSDRTKIEWTRSDDGTPGATWNPVTGCTKLSPASPGCQNCYASTFAERFRGAPGHYFERGFDVQLRPEKLDQPIRWRKPRRIFVNSMSDLFHDDVPTDFIAKVFAIMALAPQHTFQLLTKRHGRMGALLRDGEFQQQVYDAWGQLEMPKGRPSMEDWPWSGWPLPNVWLGVSAEDQKRADLRIPALLDTPAAVRFVSAEPLLGPIDLCRIPPYGDALTDLGVPGTTAIDWVIVGGESGPGARPMHPDWARSMRDQCVAADVPFLFKQWGEWSPEDGLNWSEGNGRRLHYARNYLRPDGTCAVLGDDGRPGVCMERVGKRRTGRELDGRTWDQYPEAVR
ncbi:bacteriophage protein gp37 [Mycobacteroides abscessus]|uniref:DUF5131 family protein n=1 Tax=Mycobacteroides abscessus TaxID=36809 RepID=UPI0005DF9382|nr:phage Gp37/Gp68 family protein [Mycobacteroides abscessus]CPT76963.1 bacteriophage protein gp37 [Mycobacteroides abscessus]CPU48095.1 bacteriophage protein gp37 [Mycobacteroides abscessus]SKW92805.1 bacteriophage protein gp37 [Mycobacteroides abscessus subsp. massiliense]